MELHNEMALLSVMGIFTEFFSSNNKGVELSRKQPDWDWHSLSDWQREYDCLFRGTDAGRHVNLWASASKEDGVLLNQTTLEVIEFYHAWGYTPVKMEGNPADYIGEQLRFVAYLTAGIIHVTGTGESAEKIMEAREEFTQLFVFDTAVMLYKQVKSCTTFEGYISILENLLKLLVQSEDIPYAWLSGGGSGLFDEVREKGLYPPISNEPEKMIPTAGINNCGGICVIKPIVKEGCMLNISTDSSDNAPQLRACVRGRGYRKTFLNTARLRYPMKRVGARGEGKFERITWEEAIDTIAREWIRIKNSYGPGSRFIMHGTGVTGVMRPENLMKRLMALDGGYLGFYNNYSAACTMVTTPYIYGTMLTGNSPSDLINTKLLILWGDNPAETIMRTERSYYMAALKAKGVRVICIDPRQSQSAVAYADEWVPLRPTTDSALADAMAYVIWTEGLQNQHFMDTYCQGFDEAHMPEGIKYGESYHSYLFGKKDGIVKTPEWGEKITGVPAETIRRIAREYATTKPACLIMGLGPQRHGNGELAVRSTAMLTCLTGNIGIPGGSAAGAGGTVEHDRPMLYHQPANPYPASIPVFLWTKAIERGTEMTVLDDHIEGAAHLDSNIKMIVNLAGNTLLNQHSDINDTMRILKDTSKCEFIVCSDIFMTPSAKYADILLPATSFFEENNIVAPWRGGNYFLKNNKVIEPIFGCRFEWYWMKELAEKLGLYDAFIDKKADVDMWLRDVYEKLRQNEASLPDFETFSEVGGHQFAQPLDYIAFENEIKDPTAHPFATPSGKIEVFSKRLYEMNQLADIPAIPKYVPCPEGPEDSIKEKYPLQLIGWHTRRRTHSIHDNNEWMEEIEMPGLWIHPDDAKNRGIERGHMVEIYNDRGRVRIPAIVTTRIMQGVVAMSQGGWYTPDCEGTDTRGSINILTSAANPTPLAKGNPQHTNLVEVTTGSNMLDQ